MHPDGKGLTLVDDELIAHFDDPPVVEVIAGVTFEDMGSNLGPLLSAFWKERLRENFPRVEIQPPYFPPVETFPVTGQAVGVQIEAVQQVPFNRLWVTGVDGAELIQLQPGWFACNWRKVQKDGKYVHWPTRRDFFVHWFNELADFLRTEQAGPLKLMQAEVTYMNHIHPNSVWQTHADFAKIFTASLGPGGSGIGKLEQITAQTSFALQDESDAPYGRLHVKLIPAFGRDGRSPLYVFELTARGRVGGDDTTAAERFFDKARNAVVQTFLSLTSEEIQAEWGKR